MANNPYVNKVVFGNDTVMDISDTTAEESDVVSGKTFYKKSGARATGTASLDVDWGDIGGTLSDQNDLAYALQQKADNTSIRAIENLIDDTVGFNGKNHADISQAEVGKDISGATDANKIRLIVPCESGKAYYMTASGTNAFNKIYYVTVADPSVIPSYVESATLPTRVAIPSGHKYIVLEFRKSSAATFADLQNLKFMVYDEDLYLTEVISGGVIYEPYHKNADLIKANREELKDTVGWTGKNLAKSYFITTNTSSGSNAMFVEGDLEPDTEYVLSFDTTNVYKFYINTYIVANGETIGITTVSGTNEMRFTTASVLSRSDSTQYNSSYGWRVLINNMAQSSTVSLTNIMLRKATIADPTYEPYHPSVKQTLRDGEVIEGKNLIPITLDVIKSLNTGSGTWSGNVYTRNDVTFTFETNRNGYITRIALSGTASGNITVELIALTGSQIKALGASLILNGGVSANAYLILRKSDWTNVARSNGSDSSVFDTSALENATTYYLSAPVTSGTNTNGFAFYPMIRSASESDPTFEPYYIPLKDSKFDRAEQRVLGAKNLLKSNATTQIINDVTFTANSDGSITVNGTATARAVYDIFSYIKPTANRYIVSKGASNADLGLAIDANNSGSWVKSLAVSSTIDEIVFTVDYNGYNQLRPYIYVSDGATISNVTIKPMLRFASDPDNTYVPYAMTNKELTDKVESIYKTATASSDGSSVTFTGVDTSKSYELEADLGTSWNGPAPSYTNIQISGTTVIYTLENATAGQSFRLIDLKR